VTEQENLRREFSERFPRVKIYDVSIGDLNEADGIRKMLAFFGLTDIWNDGVRTRLGKLTNIKV
jgi:hypothetical protein